MIRGFGADRLSAGATMLCAWIAVVCLLAPLPGKATARASRSPAHREATPGAIQTGRASWYGRPHHGRRTASGQVYDMYKLTAAHRKLPLGTRVLVTNLQNHRFVEVRVNDRGPYVKGRMIDLSYAAARRLRAVAQGVVPVSIRILSVPSSS
jgi:rare lipoprotein A (peptidoglycan hydrolase)